VHSTEDIEDAVVVHELFLAVCIQLIELGADELGDGGHLLDAVGFERHMGYSVPEHVAALEQLGPTIHHRRSFAPVAKAWLESADDATVPNVLPL
jgi:hypothetical protein